MLHGTLCCIKLNSPSHKTASECARHAFVWSLGRFRSRQCAPCRGLIAPRRLYGALNVRVFARNRASF